MLPALAILLNFYAAYLLARVAFRLPTTVAAMERQEMFAGPQAARSNYQHKLDSAIGIGLIVISGGVQGAVAAGAHGSVGSTLWGGAIALAVVIGSGLWVRHKVKSKTAALLREDEERADRARARSGIA